MRITTFNPQIITKDAEPIVKLFEELGFEKRHNPDGIGDLNVEGIRMKDANGFYLDISMPEVDEAYKMLTERGFKNFYGDKTVEMESSKSALMISPSGFAFNLVQHIKE